MAGTSEQEADADASEEVVGDVVEAVGPAAGAAALAVLEEVAAPEQPGLQVVEKQPASASAREAEDYRVGKHLAPRWTPQLSLVPVRFIASALWNGLAKPAISRPQGTGALA